jgi:hypothetical protein
MRYIALAIAVLLLSGCNFKHDIEVTESVPSPDGSMDAIAYADSGGGAAGFCLICTDVVPAGSFNKQTARCSHSVQWFECPTTLKLRWLSPQSVLVSYAGQPSYPTVPKSQPAPSTQSVTLHYQAVK